MSESPLCGECGGRLSFVGERTIDTSHIHREYECRGCLAHFFACSTEGYKVVQRSHG